MGFCREKTVSEMDLSDFIVGFLLFDQLYKFLDDWVSGDDGEGPALEIQVLTCLQWRRPNEDMDHDTVSPFPRGSYVSPTGLTDQ